MPLCTISKSVSASSNSRRQRHVSSVFRSTSPATSWTTRSTSLRAPTATRAGPPCTTNANGLIAKEYVDHATNASGADRFEHDPFLSAKPERRQHCQLAQAHRVTRQRYLHAHSQCRRGPCHEQHAAGYRIMFGSDSPCKQWTTNGADEGAVFLSASDGHWRYEICPTRLEIRRTV